MKPIEDLKVGDYVLVNIFSRTKEMKVVRVNRLLLDSEVGGFIDNDDDLYFNDGANSLCSARRKIIMKEKK